MTITTDGALGASGILLSLVVGFLAWRFSHPIRAELQNVRVELTELRQKYNELILEYWRVVAENEWLRRAKSITN